MATALETHDSATQGPWVVGPPRTRPALGSASRVCTCGRRGRRGRLRSSLLLLAIGALLPWSVQTAWASFGQVSDDRPEHRNAEGFHQDDASSDPGQMLPELVHAFRDAEADAAVAGVEIVITSGYRTPERQQELYEEAIVKYGSAKEAHRWVLPPEESEHVRGRAIDVGPPAAADWLQLHGARYGLCRTYANEWWHFEHRREWQRSATCPPLAADPG